MENNFDRFVRKKLDDRKFEFKEAYWEEALAMINGEKSKNRDRMWWFIPFALGVFIFAIVSLPVQTSKQPVPEIPSNIEKRTMAAIVQEGSDKSDLITKPDHSSNKEPISNNLQNDNQELGGERRTPNKDISEELIAIPDIKPPRIIENEISRDRINSGVPVFENPGGNSGSPLSLPEAFSDRIHFEPISYIPIVNADLIASYSYEFNKIADLNNQKKWYVTLYSSALYSTANRKFEGGSTGAGFNYNVSPRWGIHSGVEMNYRKGDYGPSMVNSRINYSFGKEVESLKTIPSEFYYLSIPIYATYRMGRHSFGAGLNNEILISARGNQLLEVHRESDMVFEPTMDAVITATDIKIPPKGLDKWETRALLEYQYSFSSRLAFGSRALIGLPLNAKAFNFDERIEDLSGLSNAQLNQSGNPLEEQGNHSLAIFLKYRVGK